MTKKEQFHDYCEQQIERLGAAFPDVRFMRVGALQELTTWLEEHAKGDKSRAAQFITSVTEFANMPTIAQLNTLWYQMWPNKDTIAREAREVCQRCHGTGFISVDGPFGLSAAYPCTHAPETEADRRMGLRLTPALQSSYAAEARRSDNTHVELLRRRAESGDKGFQRVTQNDVDDLLARIGA